MIPNLPNYRIITIPSTTTLGIHIKTTYTEPKTSMFSFFNDNSNIQKYPVVCKIDKSSDAYKNGLQIGDSITKLNNHSLAFKEVNTLLSDFLYEKKISKFLKLKIF